MWDILHQNMLKSIFKKKRISYLLCLYWRSELYVLCSVCTTQKAIIGGQEFKSQQCHIQPWSGAKGAKLDMFPDREEWHYSLYLSHLSITVTVTNHGHLWVHVCGRGQIELLLTVSNRLVPCLTCLAPFGICCVMRRAGWWVGTEWKEKIREEKKWYIISISMFRHCISTLKASG